MAEYEREKLYKEVWDEPVSTVAKRYCVSDVAIRKICKSMDIPVPPRGYWAKKRAGQKVRKEPLPKTDKRTTVTRYYSVERKPPAPEPELMDILSEEEYQKLYSVAESIEMLPEGSRYHKTIAAYKASIDTWKKEYGNYDYHLAKHREHPAPELTNTVSDQTRPRVFCILNSLVKSTAELGGGITEKLYMIVRGETVPVTFSEAKDKNDHVLTKQEERELAEYERKSKTYSWAHKPNIRKYDHVFNGKLTIKINNHYSFRDSESRQIEDRLTEILFALYKASEEVRLERLRREEEEREAEEERQEKEHRLELYNAEVDITNSLINEANDYEIACRIRRYVECVRSLTDPSDQETQEWIDWANKKADWFDPAVAREDPALGIRNHGLPPERKKLEHLWSIFWLR